MSSLGEAPEGMDLGETKVPALVSGFAVTWAFALIFVGLRLASRRLANMKLWSDDWLIVISLLFSAAFMFDVICYMTISGGFGRHIWVAPENGLKVYFLGLFIAEYTYATSMVLVKWSILAFYWRIFSASKTIRWFIWAIFAMVCAWGIAVVLVTTFQCWPISAFWLQFDSNAALSPSDFSCDVDVRDFFIANATANIITDVLMLLIPIPGILPLQLRKSQKLGLIGIFILGFFVTAVSCIRLHYVVALDFSYIDVTWMFSEEMMWTGIEVNIATVCACLPSLKPILNLALHGTVNASSGGPTPNSLPSTGRQGNSRQARRSDMGPPLKKSMAGMPKVKMHEDTHPFSALTDNDSDTWLENGSDTIELNQVDKQKSEGHEGIKEVKPKGMKGR